MQLWIRSSDMTCALHWILYFYQLMLQEDLVYISIAPKLLRSNPILIGVRNQRTQGLETHQKNALNWDSEWR